VAPTSAGCAVSAVVLPLAFMETALSAGAMLSARTIASGGLTASAWTAVSIGRWSLQGDDVLQLIG
jgi:hypothetical protein